jgi:hypothetical protein
MMKGTCPVSRRLILAAGTCLILLMANGQDTIKQSHVYLHGYVKDLQTVIFRDVKEQWITSSLVHNRLNFKWLVSSSLTGAVELRNRFLYGDIIQAFPGYNASFELDNGTVDLSANLLDERSFLLNTSVDRLWLDFSREKLQMTVGRQRINWGQTFVWNPNDIFNTYSYFDFDYEEKPGSDAVRMQLYTGAASVAEAAVKVDRNDKVTAAGLYRTNRWEYDFQFLGGVVDQSHYVVGTGWSGQVLKGGFRGETSYFHPEKNFSDTSGYLVASAGYDYTFKNSMFFQVEALYNGARDTFDLMAVDQFNNNTMSARNIFLPDFSFFVSAAYPITPLFNASLACILTPGSGYGFILPSASISLKDNLELAFFAQLFQYYGTGPGHASMTLVFARLKGSF